MNNAQTLTATASSSPINAYRLVAIHRRHDGKEYHSSALLYRDGNTTEVEWTSKALPDSRLKAGVIVSPRFGRAAIATSGALEISRLVMLERPEATINLFDMVPESWVANRDLIDRASTLWKGLPYYFQSMFNTIFWCGERFKRYCVGQSSIRHHHAYRSGNLEHSIEVAEIMLSLLHLYPDGNQGVAIMAGLLHDAGKADEYYELGGKTALSHRGRLLGHKVTIVEWIAISREKMRVGVPDPIYLSLVHALTATASTAAYTGLRDPKTTEATLISYADRISGKSHLASTKTAPRSHYASRHRSETDTTMINPLKQSIQQFQGMEALLRSIRSSTTNASI